MQPERPQNRDNAATPLVSAPMPSPGGPAWPAGRRDNPESWRRVLRACVGALPEDAD